jgi:hypothetical protein
MKSKKLPLEKVRQLNWKEYFQLWKQTIIEFTSENSLFHGAALSYYTVFALVPIIYLSIVSFGKIIGQKTSGHYRAYQRGSIHFPSVVKDNERKKKTKHVALITYPFSFGSDSFISFL